MYRGFILLVLAVLASVNMGAQSHYPGQHEDKFKVPNTTLSAADWFELRQILLLDSPFKANMEREIKWIMSIDNNRLLHSFRTNAGVWAGLEGGYTAVKKLGGWESLDCELRGHTMGHVLSGLALLYAQTGEQRFRLKADSLINGLEQVQTTLNSFGYLSAFPEELINRNMRATGVWAPWYTLHKIYAGLMDQYLLCNNEKAFLLLQQAANWAVAKLEGVDDEQRRKMIRNEFGGINETFYNLYALTDNEKYKGVADFFYHEAVLDPLKRKETNLNKLHANTFIPKLLGEARKYEIEGARQGRELSEFFWHAVVDHQTFAPGCNSHKEKFIPTDSISKYLSGYTGESCNSYNMLKLTRHLFSWNPNAEYMDYYERVLYNQILGQQDPKTGMVAYFLPMLAGAHKVYSTPYQSFWCCVGSSFENQAKYGETVYAHKANRLFVNLYVPTELNWEQQKVKLKQETLYPESGTSLITLHPEKQSQELTLSFRYPTWAKGMRIYVNGKKHSVRCKAGNYADVHGFWKKGDQVRIEIDRELRLIEANDDPTVAAVAYGPVVLAGRLGSEGFTGCQPDSDPTKHNDYYTYDYNVPANLPVKLKTNGKHLSTYLRRVDADAPLDFVTAEGVRLSPLYQIHRERYIIYWQTEF